MVQNTEFVEQRHFIRHPMCLPLKYTIIKSRKTIGNRHRISTTANIGRGGLMFSAESSVEIGSLIRLRIPFQKKIFNIKAKVVYCKKNSETEFYDIGVCFLKSKDAFQTKLIEQIYLISEYRDLRSIQLGKDISLEEASQEWIKRYSERFKKLYW